MGVAARSREEVEERLAGLQVEYGSFPVNQTTVTLPHERFERVSERHSESLVDAYVRVHNDADEVLQVRRDGDPGLPGTAAGREESLETGACRAVRQETGVACDIAGIDEVTIAGIRDEDAADPATLYRLVVVFDGEHREGAPAEAAEWGEPGPAEVPAYV